MNFRGGMGLCVLVFAVACGKAADGPLLPAGANTGAVPDAASTDEPDATTGSAGSNSSPDDPSATPAFATPGTGVPPVEMYGGYMGPATQDDSAGASSAPPCPVMDEEVLATLDGEQYVLGRVSSRLGDEFRIIKNCDGVAWWEFSSCDETGEVCLRLRHLPGPDDVVSLAELRIGDQDDWVIALDPGDLGESFWCEKNDRWYAWIDTAFTKDVFQVLDGPTRPLEVTVKAYVPGEVCQRVE